MMSSQQVFRVVMGVILVLLVSGIIWILALSGRKTPQASYNTDSADHPGTFYTIEKKYADSPIDGYNVDDEIVDHYRTQNTVRKIEKLSGRKFHQTQTILEADYLNNDRIFTSGKNNVNNHDAWTEMYNEVNFYKWLLRFKK